MSSAKGPARVLEVARDVLRIEVPLGERLNTLHVLAAAERLLLWDTGTDPDPAGALVPALHERDLDPSRLRYVIDSHADVDHMGGNRAVTALAPDAILMCGEPDRGLIEDVERMIGERYGEFSADHGIVLEPGMAEWCRAVARDVTVDIGLVGGERLRIDAEPGGWTVEVLATPGHSPGSISLWDARSRALLIGDAVLGACLPAADGRPSYPPTYRHVDDYLRTIAIVESLEPDVLLAAHEPVMRGPEVAVFLATSRDFVARLDDAVRAALRGGRWTLADLALELGPRLGDWPAEAHPVIRYALLGHLERLVARGEATAVPADGRFSYAAST